MVAAPDDDAERMEHTPVRLQWHGGALEVPARAGIQAGDLLHDRLVHLVRTCHEPGYQRTLAWLTDPLMD